MRYEEPVFRPPSEAASFILQATIGCSHNKCTFCPMYKTKKYRERPLEEIKEDINSAARGYSGVRKVFLADGDALVLDTQVLLEILKELYLSFPILERVSIYATPKNLLEKSVDDLRKLKDAGLGIVYFGLESGSAQILENVRKGFTPEEMITAGQKAVKAGLPLSVTVILGLGGREDSKEHALETARVVSAINPQYLGALTLMVNKHAPLHKRIEKGEFTLLNSLEVLEELELIIANLETTKCIFRSNHASNYLPLKGVLKEDRKKLLSLIKEAKKDPSLLRGEIYRGL